MATDYAPVISSDDEDQRRQWQGVPYEYPPAPSGDLRQFGIGSGKLGDGDTSAASPAPATIQATPKFESGSQAAPDLPLAQPEGPKRPEWKDYAPAEPHGWSKFGHVMASVTGVGDEYFNRRPERRAEHDYQAATSDYDTNFREQTEAPLRAAQTHEAEANANAKENPAPEKVGQTPEEQTLHDLMTGENGAPRVNPATGKPFSYLEAYQATKQSAQDVKPDKAKTTREITRVVGGVPHTVMVDAENGADVRDEGQTKIPGESAADKRSAAESVQVEREARTAVHKAEQDYNSARSTVAMQKELIKEATGGNKEAVRMVPLESALEITTSQGVHRINKTEVEQYGQAGSLYDKIVGAIGSGVSGKNIPDNVLKDMQAMTQEMEKNAHDRYKREYDYNKQVVEGYGGKDFEKRVPMVQGEEQSGGIQRPAGVPPEYIHKDNGPKEPGWYKP